MIHMLLSYLLSVLKNPAVVPWSASRLDLISWSSVSAVPCRMRERTARACSYCKWLSLGILANYSPLIFTVPCVMLLISRAQPPSSCSSNGCCPHHKHYAQGRINQRCIVGLMYKSTRVVSGPIPPLQCS
jgi:hypothetical protein